MNLIDCLHKNERGRWQYGDRELTCGDVVEIDIGVWLRCRIEHNGRDYYFLAPDGLTAIALCEWMPARTPERSRVWP